MKSKNGHRIIHIATMIVALALALTAEGQGATNVTIAGLTANGTGKVIGVYGYADMLTMEELLLDETRIDESGRFELRLYANYPRLVFIQVENFSQSFYVEPGRRYEVWLPEFDWDLGEKRNIFLAPEALHVEFLNLPSDELNLKVGAYEALVDSFVTANRVFFDPKFRPQRRWFDTLVTLVERRFPSAEGSFFDYYKRYTLAEMQLAMHFVSRKKLIAKYIDGQPVRYHDETYMRLFMALFDGSVSRGMGKVPLNRLKAWVEKEDLAVYLDSLGIDPLLRNERVRELAALQALKESWYNAEYDGMKVRRMIEHLGRESRFPEHKELAQRLAASLGRYERGNEAERFSLPDVDRKMVALDDFKGKWVYLSFVRCGDPNSLSELETLAFFRDSVYAKNPDVVFVSVVCDREFQKMYHLLRTSKRGHKYNWTWLHFDGNYRLLEHYGVVSYPTFVLIGPDGKLQYNITPTPASGFLLHGPWEKKTEKKDDGVLPFYMR